MSKFKEERLSEFKQHPTMPNYMVAKDGRVLSRTTRKTMKSRINTKTNPYNIVSVRVAGRSKGKKLAVLILETYVGPRPPGYHAAHLNGNRFDDRLENLAWVTPKENASHKFAHGTARLGELASSAKLMPTDILKIRSLFRAKSMKKTNALYLAKKFGVSPSNILLIVRRITWKHI